MAENSRTTALSPVQPLNGHRVLRISPSADDTERMKIGTWNVRSLYQAGNLDNVVKEMGRMKIDILGICEHRWTGNGEIQCGNGKFYYSGNGDAVHRNGVGVIVNGKYRNMVTGFAPLSDRIALLRLKSGKNTLNIIQVYAPTADPKYDEEIEDFYEDLQKLVDNTKSNEILIIMGDMNAKIGAGRRGDLVGPFGLGETNERGNRLFHFCETNNMAVMNTWFQLPKRRLYTWKSPQDDGNTIIRNQIDYILIRKRYRNSIKRVAAYPGADMGSDHNPIIAKFDVKWKIIRRKLQDRNYIDVTKLRNRNFKTEVARKTNEQFERIYEQTRDTDLKQQVQRISSEIKTLCQKELKRGAVKKRSQWITDEILDLMETRRGLKRRTTEYRTANREIKRKIREAKNEWMEKECKEIEELQEKHDSFNVHRKVKELSGIYRKKTPTCLTKEDGKFAIDIEEKLQTWKKYVENLYNDTRQEIDILCLEEEKSVILKTEVEYAINLTKNRKATGPDEIPGEIIKLLDDGNIGRLTELFNKIYDTGEIPDEWLRSTFVVLPKKPIASKCDDYRMISLISHLSKAFIRIIHARIRNVCEKDLDKSQFGFRQGFGTREALLAVNVLFQKCRDQRKDVFACFLDYEKAFDRVKHEEMIQILKDQGINNYDLRIIRNLYWKQSAKVLIDGQVSENIDIRRGVRQGCILSPILFNTYADRVFKEALSECEYGIKVNGKNMNNIRYADDTVLFADSVQALQEIINRVNEEGKKYGLNINEKKTKFMVISRDEHPDVVITINNRGINRVQEFKYLGCYITSNLEPEIEVKRRCGYAKNAFERMKKVFTDKTLSLQLRQRLVKCYIYSILLYGAETATYTVKAINYLEACEMWLHRRMLRISWTQKLRNSEVLELANTERTILETIKKRKLGYFGHVIRGEKYELLRLIIQGKIEGKRGPGRRKNSWMKNIRQWTGMDSVAELIRAAESREI